MEIDRRINRDEMCMQWAVTAAARSTCRRRQVGAIIALDGRPLSVGYGGSPPDFPHCTPETCTPQNPCKNTTHAEINAIAWAARKGVAVEEASLYCTLSPCDACAKAIIAAGIREVIFYDSYRITDPIGLLIQGKVQVFSLKGQWRVRWERSHIHGLRQVE